MDIKEYNAITGEVTEREYTAAEKADYDSLVAKAKAELDAELAANEAKAADKAALLTKLGITADEAKLLLG
jgi:hypothetical protein